MDSPFTNDEIKVVLEDMPSDHGPGSLHEKCWYIIENDLKKLCTHFATGQLDMTSINGSFIVLIPKKENPTTVNEYRPI